MIEPSLSEMATHHSVGAVVGLDRVALSGFERPNEGSREHDLAGLERGIERAELADEPGNAVRRMIEHTRGEPGLLDDAVAVAKRADPAHVRIEGTERPAADHDPGIRRVIRDGVDDLA